ncbi:MAG TPA: MarR family transcriptional regulator [Rhizomicrobium sp.]
MQRKDGVRAIERAMFEIARNLGRRDLGRQVERRHGEPVDGSQLLVVDAIDEGSESGAPPTVGHIARLLDVHPSRASRMVKSAIRAGIAVRVASQDDGRQSCLELSARGRKIAKALRGARARYFAIRMKGWPRTDRLEFARLLVRFAKGDRMRSFEHGGDPGPDAVTPAPDGIEPARLAARLAKRGKSA